MLHFIVLLQILFEITLRMVSSDDLSAHLSRFARDCPGTNEYKELPEEEIKHITLSVADDDKDKNDTIYNYYQVEELAKDPHADFNKPTVLFVSGYTDRPGSSIGTNMSLVYRQLGFTVLLLYARVFYTNDYYRASRDTRPVGKHAAEMLANLTKHGLDPKELSVVGISLGGQTISFIGKYFKEITGVNISRITGLDPAGPCFAHLGPEGHLHSSDADYVDVIKTNIDDYGMVAPNGHVDFYVNGGVYQPGENEMCEISCSHIRSYYLWIAALYYPNNFIAVKCDSVEEARNNKCYNHEPQVTNVLGLYTDQSKQGIFYLPTSGQYPYYLGDEGLKKPMDSHTKGSILIGLKSIITKN